MRTKVLAVAAAVLTSTTLAHAAMTPEQKCQKGRHDAAAKYAQCQNKAIGAFHGGGTVDKLEDTLSKCRTTDPCIDPVFGPTRSGFYWTSTSVASDDAMVWVVDFVTGIVGGSNAITLNVVRAVRGGL